jgi:hypothetical protein
MNAILAILLATFLHAEPQSNGIRLMWHAKQGHTYHLQAQRRNRTWETIHSHEGDGQWHTVWVPATRRSQLFRILIM